MPVNRQAQAGMSARLGRFNCLADAVGHYYVTPLHVPSQLVRLQPNPIRISPWAGRTRERGGGLSAVEPAAVP